MKMKKCSVRFLAGLVLLLLPLPLFAEQQLPQPSGEVILTIEGNLSKTNAPGKARFDRAMLEELGLEELRTSTLWTEGVAVFRGVSAGKLLAHVGAEGHIVRGVALNDYESLIPMSDFTEYPVLLAMEMNGKRLTRRDKGPLWIVYPRDSFAELDKEVVHHRWIWQLRKLYVQ